MTTEMHKAPSVAHNTGTSGNNATSVARYDLSTSEGGRRYVADFFARELRRHDFARYITTTLAADFACALAQHLAATGKQQVGAFPWENLPAYLIDRCEGDTISEEGIQRAVADMAKDARYCPPQQVGEVQGDALVPVQPRALAASIAELEALMEDECLDPLTTSESESVMLVLHELKRLQLVAARQPGAQEPVEMSPEFTDTARAAIAWVLWHHQGGSSPVGQPLRFSLGMGQHDRMTDHQIAEAKRFAEWAGATTEGFHRHKVAQGIDLGQFRPAVELFLTYAESEVAAHERFWGHAPDASHRDAKKLAEANRLLALIDQRDAAPGVGNG